MSQLSFPRFAPDRLQLSDESDLDNPRSPNSPPPPPPGYSGSASTRLPTVSKSISKPPPSSAHAKARNVEQRALKKPQKETTQEAARKQREERKVEKEAEKEASRLQRVRKALTAHKSTALGRQSSIRIQVSPPLFNDNSRNDVLRKLRIMYPIQIDCIDNRRSSSLITWRRLNPVEEDVPFCLFYFRAEQYLKHIAHDSLHECALGIKGECQTNHRILLAVSGMDRELKLRTRQVVRNDLENGGRIITKEAVLDSYTYLEMKYDIRTHDAADLNELANYLCDVTDAITAQPFRKEQDFITASIRNRVSRANVSNRTVVMPSQSNEEMAEEDFNLFGYDPLKKTEGVRVEGRRDLGNIYLLMLCLIPGVTLIKATAIREQYPTLKVLLDAFDDCQTEAERVCMLADLRSGQCNRRLGPALSKTIAGVLTSVDASKAI